MVFDEKKNHRISTKLPAYGRVQGVGLTKTLPGPLQRTCGPRTARGAALETGESRGAAGAQKVCVGAEALRARSAALSKLIVRREQNNFAGGGTVAGLVLWAPVAARRDEVRAPKTHHVCSVQNVGDVFHTWVIRGQLKTIITCEHKIKVPKAVPRGSRIRIRIPNKFI